MTAITSQLSRGTSGISPFALAEEADLKLSYVTVADNTERDAIEEWKRLPYMLCYVSGTDITYRLGANVTIAGQVWTVESFGVPDEVLTEDEILNAEGYIKPELIQNIFLNDNFVVASEAAMLALSTRTGNFVIRTDTGEIYVKLNNDDPAALADFAEITYPGAVLSVNGLTGAVTITADTLIAADLAAFNTRVGATTTISTINTDITAIETDIAAIEADLLLKADLVAGLVPIAQLPYTFSNGLTGTTDISIGGTLTNSIDIDGGDSYNISFQNLVELNLESSIYDFVWNDFANTWTLTADSIEGFRYTTDISTNFSNHSLVTKQFTDNKYIAKTGTNILADTTSILAGVGDSLTLASGTITSSNQSRVTLGNDSVALTMYNTAQSAAHSLSLGVNGLSYIQGTGTGLSGAGITYAADYSASFNARSLVDKGYVDSVVVGWAKTGTTSLTGNSIISLPTNYSLTFLPSNISSTLIFGGDDGGFEEFPFSDITVYATNGIEYGADYSAAYTTRSLIDKGYADIAYIKTTGTTDLVGNITIQGDTTTGKTILMRTKSSGNSRGLANLSSTASLFARVNVNGSSNSVNFTETNSTFTYSPTDGVGGHKRIEFNDTQMLITDNNDSKGFEYAADYSANFSSRSLVDKAYVDSVSGGGGGWATTGTTLLTGNAYIEGGSGESIEFNITHATLNTRFYQSGEEIYLQNNVSSTFTDSKIIATGSYGSIQSNNATGGVDFKVYHGGSTYLQWGSASGGIQYFADYSSDFVDRSLADWGNVWKVKGTTTITELAIVQGDENSGINLVMNDSALDVKSELLLDPFSGAVVLRSTGPASDLPSATRGQIDISQDDVILYSYGAGIVPQIRLNIGTALFTDSRVTKTGLQYAADYSSTFTDRSLADWGNVWKVNGTTTTTGTVNINTDGAGGLIYIGDDGNGGLAMFVGDINGVTQGYAGVGGSGADFSFSAVKTGASEFINLIANHTTADMYIVDNRLVTKGIEYAADYSAEFTDRSLADWGNVLRKNATTSLTADTLLNISNGTAAGYVRLEVGAANQAGLFLGASDSTGEVVILIDSSDIYGWGGGGFRVMATGDNNCLLSAGELGLTDHAQLSINSSGASFACTSDDTQYFTQHTVNEQSVTITQDYNGTSKQAIFSGQYGWRYAADYSANYTSRSLIDKGFFDSKHLTTTVSHDFGATAANSESTLGGISIVGAAVGDVVVVGVPTEARVNGAVYTAYVSATDTVTLILSNIRTVSINPLLGTFRLTVLKP